MQNVVDVQKREAREDFGRSQGSKGCRGIRPQGPLVGRVRLYSKGMAEEGLQNSLVISKRLEVSCVPASNEGI